MSHPGVAGETKETVLIAVYDAESRAQQAIEKLIDKGFPMDMMSVLGRIHPSGDDVLGIYHVKAGERIEAWAKQGALWGAIWGLFAGAAGMFILPGLGPILAAGPAVEAIVGAVGGAAVGSAAMSGAAAATHLATAMHRMGIPEERIDYLHREIEEGRYLLLLRVATEQIQEWKAVVGWSNAKELIELPYTGIKDFV